MKTLLTLPLRVIPAALAVAAIVAANPTTATTTASEGVRLMARPDISCDPAVRGEPYNELTLAIVDPLITGQILIDVQFGWDGVSVSPNCDGPVQLLHTRNTSQTVAWALLPNKKKPPLYVQINPGDDVTITAKGTLNNLGLSNASDVSIDKITFTNPAG